MKPGSPELEAWSPNHWTTRDFPRDRIIILISLLKKLRHREVEKFAQVQVACMRESQDLNPDSNPVLSRHNRLSHLDHYPSCWASVAPST